MTPEQRPRSEWLPWALFGALAVRLCLRTSAHAVDLLYWDQWDFYRPVFAGDGPWTFFAWQHGPQREGVGGLIQWAVSSLTRFDVRAEVLVSLCVVLLGALAGMLLARRFRGRLDLLDAAVPLLLLGGLHAEVLTEVPNPSHGPAPFALVLFAALAATAARPVVRAALLAVLAPVTMYTGFTLIFAPFVLLALALDASRAPAEGRPRWPALVALAFALCACATFFVGYRHDPALACYQFPAPHPQKYLPFAALLLVRPLGAESLHGAQAAWVTALVLPLLACGAWGCARALRTRGADNVALLVLLLAGFAAAFAALTAVGRVCLGLDAAAAPRYAPYVLPGLVACWLFVRERAPDGRWKQVALAAALMVCAGKEVWLEVSPGESLARTSAGKRAVRACLREGTELETCQERARFEVYPYRAAWVLEEIRYLREHKLGLFREGQ